MHTFVFLCSHLHIFWMLQRIRLPRYFLGVDVNNNITLGHFRAYDTFKCEKVPKEKSQEVQPKRRRGPSRPMRDMLRIVQ